MESCISLLLYCRKRGFLIAVFLYLQGIYKKLERDFTRACNDKTRKNGLKLKESSFSLDIAEEIIDCDGGKMLEKVV